MIGSLPASCVADDDLELLSPTPDTGIVEFFTLLGLMQYWGLNAVFMHSRQTLNYIPSLIFSFFCCVCVCSYVCTYICTHAHMHMKARS